MISYILRRIVYMAAVLILLSIVSFIIIELPPGDYLSNVMASMLQSGKEIDQAAVRVLRAQYGLDLPLPLRYLHWMSNILFHGDLGRSFEWNLPVATLIAQRLPLTLDEVVVSGHDRADDLASVAEQTLEQAPGADRPGDEPDWHARLLLTADAREELVQVVGDANSLGHQ